MNDVPSTTLLCAQVWPLTTRVQEVLEGKNTSTSRVACVLHLMEKVLAPLVEMCHILVPKCGRFEFSCPYSL